MLDNQQPCEENRSISNFFDLEDLLYRIVVEANTSVTGDACSIFLWDDEAGCFVLRESTVMTPFIGKYSLDHTRNAEKERSGITTGVAITGKAYLSPDVRQDSKWSWSGLSEQDLPSSKTPEHCEIPARDLLSIIAVPIKSEEGEVAGVLRVLRRRGKEPFSPADRQQVEDLVGSYSRLIFGTLSLGKLIEIGCILNLKELCQKAVELLTKMVAGKGCSIFLLNEENSTREVKIYCCEATTGLEQALGEGSYKCLDDPARVYYEVPGEANRHLTAFVAHKKRNVVIEDLHSCDFEREFGIQRTGGSGKNSEAFSRSGARIATGPLMATPLFFREKFDPDTPAMGVIRVTRPHGDAPFGLGEQRRFFSFAEKLSKTILQARYISLLKDLSTAEGRDEKFQKVVSEVPKLIGGKGCSVFVGTDRLEMKATFGALEEKFAMGRVLPYDLSNRDVCGFTGAASLEKRPVLWNDAVERKGLEKEGIRSSGRQECEVAETPPARFLVVPILAGERSVGVIRIAKTRTESPFSSNDLSMLESIAGHLGRLIQANNINVLRSFVDPTVYDIILRNPSYLAPKKRWITICFWDIRGFSRMCETLATCPQMIAGFIQEYCDIAADIIFKHQGILDKFIGDGVMALFGFLGDVQDDDSAAIAAVETAKDLRAEFNGVVEKWAKMWRRHIAANIEIGLGCGIHTGEVTVGMVATKYRDQFTALGPPVNLASRIEARAKAGQILLSQTTAERVRSDKMPLYPAGEIDDMKNIPGTFQFFALDPVPAIDEPAKGAPEGVVRRMRRKRQA